MLLSLFKKNNKLFKIEKLIFYLLLLFLPTQFGKHFWPDFSLILGARIDYLSPTLYFTDVLIFFILILFLFNNFKIKKERSKIKSDLIGFKDQRSKTDSGRIFASLRLARMTSFWGGIQLCWKRLQNLIIKNWKLLVLALFLIIGILISKSPFAGFYGFLKLFEFSFFGFYVSQNIKIVKEIATISLIFSFGILFESFLAIAQIINNGSLNGIFYYFGERAFNAQTLGVANASINGELILRPYSTFPHPNVLAGFLVIAMTIVISKIKDQTIVLSSKRRISKNKLSTFNSQLSILIMVSALGLGTVALFLTLSRIAILLWFIIASYFILRYFLSILFAVIPARRFGEASPLGGKAGIQKSGSPIPPRGLAISWRRKSGMTKARDISFLFVALVFISVIGSILFLSPIHYRFMDFNLNDESVVVRTDLIKSSITMIGRSPIFGVGLNNFLVNLPNDQNIKSQNLFTYLQPAHNIFLLVMSETGVAGFIIFIWFIIKTLNNILKKNKFSIFNFQFSILIIVLILSLFDHYFLTLQQGQLLFSFILGFCWVKYKV